MHSFLKQCLARSLFNTQKWYFHQVFQLMSTVVKLKGLVKVPHFCVKQRSCKHCFENEWTLTDVIKVVTTWKVSRGSQERSSTYFLPTLTLFKLDRRRIIIWKFQLSLSSAAGKAIRVEEWLPSLLSITRRYYHVFRSAAVTANLLSSNYLSIWLYLPKLWIKMNCSK